MKQKIKNYLFILIVSYMSLIFGNCVYASSDGINVSWDTQSFDSGGTSEDTIPNKNSGNLKIQGSTYYCNYEYTYSPSTSKTIKGYDVDGNSIAKDNKVNPSLSFVAGTWIGLNIAEVRRASWKIDTNNITYYQKIQKYNCKYSYTSYRTDSYTCDELTTQSSRSNCQNFCAVNGFAKFQKLDDGRCYCYTTCTNHKSDTTYKDYSLEVEYGDEENCPVTHPEDSRYSYIKNSKTYIGSENKKISAFPALESACWADAVKTVQGWAKSYVSSPTSEINYVDVNTYPENVEDIYIPQNTATLSGKLNQAESNNLKSREPQGKTYGVEYGVFEFKPNYVCINVKTGAVSYEKKCSNDEFDVTVDKKNSTYWRYFIPLNAKTNAKFYIKLKTNKQKLTPEECYDIMTNPKYSDYERYIIKLNEEAFYGKTTQGNIPVKDKNYVKSNGCYFSTEINFNIVQKFYNEVEENNKTVFKGFAFYYRPIDINNPFPNGVANDSLWKDVFNKDMAEDISESFDEITYVASNISTSDIREYNQRNPYTTWNNMYVDGTSEFISTKQYISRKTGLRSYYKLGCGPENASWEECS